VPEETVGEIYTKITAEMEEFDRDIDTVFSRLDTLEEKDVRVQAETKSVENSVSSLTDEMMMFGGALGAVFGYLMKTSGGLQAMWSMATGFVGAALDKYIIENILPAWQRLAETGGDVNKVLELMVERNKEMREKFGFVDNALTDFIDNTILGKDEVEDFGKEVGSSTLYTDEFGNALTRVGDDLYYYDGATTTFIGTTKDLNTEIVGVDANLAIANDLIGDLSDEWGVLASDVQLYAEGGREAFEALWAEDPGRYPGAVYMSKVADAYEEVRVRLATLLVEMGINPVGGGEITAGQKIESQLRYGGAYGDAEMIAQYLLSGGI